MAKWKRLTGVGENEVLDVNLDQVAYMVRIVNDTTLYFVGQLEVRVKETLEEIHGKASIGEFE